ncbi:MAG TPA: GNAT family N-acetyltransferase [Pseudolabrys sp.]|nr:GNAT family N-acetyltransferase [Pseudolabrys sp.]
MTVIRPAIPADVPTITRIYAEAVRTGTASFELDPPDEAEMAARMRALLAGGFPYLAAEINGALAGYAYAGHYRTRPAFRFTVEDSIYIAPAMQRRGIGRALLAALIEDSARRGFRQMVAVIGDPERQQPSVVLHQAAGFRRLCVLDDIGFKHGRWLDSMLMQRALGEGAATAPADAEPACPPSP